MNYTNPSAMRNDKYYKWTHNENHNYYNEKLCQAELDQTNSTLRELFHVFQS